MQNSLRELTSSDLRTTTLTKEDILGAQGTASDGRMFRYAQIGLSDVAAGLALSSAFPAVTSYYGLSVAGVVTAGPLSLTVTVTLSSTATTTDQFADGQLTVYSGTGKGTTYRVQGNTATAANGTCTITLYEPIVQSLDTTSVVNLDTSPWSSLVASVAPNSVTLNNPRVAGVNTIPVSAKNYCWVQTEGLCVLQFDGSNQSGVNQIWAGLSIGLTATSGQGGRVRQLVGSADADKQNIATSYSPSTTAAGAEFLAYLTIY
jgi:hypothetical protein